MRQQWASSGGPLYLLFQLGGTLQDRSHDPGHREAKLLMLIGVEVDSIDTTRVVTVAASKNSQSRSFARADNAAARPADFRAAPSNFCAMAPFGSWIGGGATMRIAGTASVSAGLERILPYGPSSVEAILDHAHVVTRVHQRLFHHTGPASGERPSPACVGNNAPAQ
jgi:hypothetical protein